MSKACFCGVAAGEKRAENAAILSGECCSAPGTAWLTLGRGLFPRRPRMELGSITAHNVKQLRILNQTVLPVSYGDKVLSLAHSEGPAAGKNKGFSFSLFF